MLKSIKFLPGVEMINLPKTAFYDTTKLIGGYIISMVKIIPGPGKKKYLSWILIAFLTAFLSHTGTALSMGTKPKLKKHDYNLLLITIDTLRADHLGCYGYKEIKTPHMDTLASEGVIFTQAITPVPITLPAHTSIMTGLYPIQHGVRNNGNFVLDEEAVTLAEIMRDNGYQTGACTGAFVLKSIFGLDQGFHFYEDSLPTGGNQLDLLYNERKAEAITPVALKWLKKNKEKKFFLWIHYFDPHAAYSPPSPFAEEYQNHPYDGEIAYTDKCIGDLWQGMKKMGLTNKTIIILTSDHGEGLGEHGEATHAIFIYEATLRVPLIIKGPKGLFPKGKSIPAMVSNMDIFPTVLELFGLEKIPDLPSKSLVPLIFGKERKIHQQILCECLCPELNFGWSRLEGMRKADVKYIQAPLPEIFHLAEDPFETKNLALKDKKYCLRLKKEFERLKQAHQPSLTSGRLVEMNQETQKRLKSLGYVWTNQARGETKQTERKKDEEKQRRDPKKMIHLMNYLDRGLSFLNAEYYDLAILSFQNIIQVNPDNEIAHFFLGAAYQKKKLLDQAEKEFKMVLVLNPSHLGVHNQIGLIHYERGKFDPALEEFKLALAQAEYTEVYYNLSLTYDKKSMRKEALAAIVKALQLDPNYAEAHNHAGNLFLAQGNLLTAAVHFKHAVQLDPRNSLAFNNLGLIYSNQGKREQAIGYFQQAINLDSNHPEAHNNLGSLYLHQGHYQPAVAELKKALQLRPDYKKALVNLGMVYFYLKNFSSAEENYRRVIEIDRDYAHAYYQLGVIYLRQGYYRLAYDEIKEYLRLQPDNQQARSLLERIERMGY